MFDRVGLAILATLASIGSVSLFGLRAIREIFLPPYEPREVIRHVFEIGWRSAPLVAGAGLALGVVLSMHTRASLERFGGGVCHGRNRRRCVLLASRRPGSRRLARVLEEKYRGVWGPTLYGRGTRGGRVNETSRVVAGVALGALCGAAVAYLFFTEHGRGLRDRIEPAVDDLRRECSRFQKTLEKVGDLANDGLRVMEEFRTARAESYPPGTTSH